MSMDLPNLVEAWRRKWSMAGDRNIDVTWYMWGDQYKSGKTTIDYIREQLEENWEILGVKEITEEVESLKEPGKMIKQYGERIDLRRKLIRDKVVHSEPNFYSFKVRPHEAKEVGGIYGHPDA